MFAEEYLTIKELAQRLGLTPKTVRNKMETGGIFRKGVHYFSPAGIGPRFKWSVVVDWLESSCTEIDDDVAGGIPMARKYVMAAPSESGRHLPIKNTVTTRS
jgi:hypothetical protein